MDHAIKDSIASNTALQQSIEKEAGEFLQRLNINVIEPNVVNLEPSEFRNQYETLLGALKLSHSRETTLIQHCKGLENEKNRSDAQLQATIRSNEENESQMEALAKDLDTVKSLLEAANEKELQDKVNIDKLEEELEHLTDQVDRSEISTIRKENEVKRLAKDVEHWRDQAETASETINAMKIEEQKTKSQVDQLLSSHKELKDDNASLKMRLSERDTEVKRGNERREHVEKELEDTQTKMEFKTKECIDIKYNRDVLENKVTLLEKQLADTKMVIVSKEQEVMEHVAKKQSLITLLDEQKKRTTALTEELNSAKLELKKSSLDHNRLSTEKTQLQRNLESERMAVLRHQQLVEDANAATRLSNEELELLKKEVDAMRKRENQFNRDLLMLKRENGLQLGRIQVSEDKVKKSGHDILHNEQVIASLEKELAEAKDTIAKKVSYTCRLESECDGLRRQVTESRSSYQRLLDELKIRDNQSMDLTRKIEELVRSVEEEKQKHDTIRVERNNTLKQLTDAQKEIHTFEHEQQNFHREIDHLRSEMATKDSALVKENYEYRKEKAQKELYADEISRLRESISENENMIHTLQSEVRQLGEAIRKMDDSALIQRQENDRIINERDILGTQLIRRNDELALLYEKIKILQTTLQRGELQYNARQDDIRLLKIKIRDLQRQLSIARGGQSGVEEMSRNLVLVQKNLIRERVKVKALSDELENPINLHRWRKLEGTDPMAYEMIQKVQILQKRLLHKTEEVMKKNIIIQKQQQQQLELEKLLARQPGPEISEELTLYQSNVRKKTKQMKAMASELNMNQAQVNEYKREIQRLATELYSFKRKYFEQKRREAETSDLQVQDLVSSVPMRDKSNTTRFLGGGFAIK